MLIEQELIEKFDIFIRLFTVQMTSNDFADKTLDEQIRILSKHGLKGKDICSLMGVKPPNVSRALNPKKKKDSTAAQQ